MTWENLGTIGSMLISLLVVLLLAYLTLRWMGGRMAVTGSRHRLIRVVDRVSIGQDKSLLVVAVADKTILVGVSNHGMSKLAELDGLPPQEDTPQGPEFSQVLRDTFTQGKRLFGKGEEHSGE